MPGKFLLPISASHNPIVRDSNIVLTDRGTSSRGPTRRPGDKLPSRAGENEISCETTLFKESQQQTGARAGALTRHTWH